MKYNKRKFQKGGKINQQVQDVLQNPQNGQYAYNQFAQNQDNSIPLQNAQSVQTQYAQATPQYQVDNKGREAWNNYVGWLQKKGVAGSPSLNSNGLGHQMLNQYMQENPNSGLTPDNVIPIQQDFQNYRQYNLNRVKQGTMQLAPGTTPDNFMSNISKVDGYPGSNTTSYQFSPQYMQSLDNNGKPVLQNTGLAAAHNFKRGGFNNQFQYGGNNTVPGLQYSLYDNMDKPSWIDGNQSSYQDQFQGPGAVMDYGSSVTGGPANPSQSYTQSIDNTQITNPARQQGRGAGMNALLAMQGTQTGLSLLSGAMERERQNQYMNTQYSALGQRNPMPTNGYQPNPYNQYSQYGGSIRKYQMGGNTFLQGSQPIPSYVDQTTQNNPLGQPQFQQGGNTQQAQEGQLAQIIQAYAQLVHQNPQQIMQQIHKLPAKQQQAALQQMAQAVQQAQAQQQQQAPQQMPQQDQQQQPGMKEGGSWLRGAVNPDHNGWCTPLSNPKCTGHRRAFALMMKKNHGFHN